MATHEQIDELTRLFAEARPQQMSAQQQHRMPASGSEGMLGVLVCLYRADGPVSAGQISKVMHVTTGRVTALTKKMVDKGLITRQASAEDARVTEIGLTDKGRQAVEELQAQRTAQMKRLIDTVGMERLRAYIETSKEVWTILTPLSLDALDE